MNRLRFAFRPLLLVALLTAGCGKDPVRPLPSPPTFLPPAIDDYPVWAHNGTAIAYFRFVASADGPPGIYLVSKWGGTPRLISAGFFGQFRFSPDDQRLLAVSPDLQLAVIDVCTGQVAQPFYTDNLVDGPDWSPDGTKIVYLKGGPNPGEPPDSGGIHIFDTAAGTDRPLVAGGSVVQGIRPLWLPSGEISFVGMDGSGRQRLAITDGAGSGLRVLYRSRRSNSFWLLTWYSRPSTASAGVLFSDNDAPPFGGIFLIRTDGSVLTRMPPFRPYVLGYGHEAFSPDGEEWVHHGFDPVDSLDVLFVSRMGDLNGASSRQLTTYSPPPNASAKPVASRSWSPSGRTLPLLP